ncbi:hypothetical protein VCHA37O177_90083 [Vibrio chagasii]|nr:hypothetical protein VCHA37O177_90083 [Vibrio chagasii]
MIHYLLNGIIPPSLITQTSCATQLIHPIHVKSVSPITDKARLTNQILLISFGVQNLFDRTVMKLGERKPPDATIRVVAFSREKNASQQTGLLPALAPTSHQPMDICYL